MNRLAIRAIPRFKSSHIVNLNPEGKLIDRVNIPGWTSANISLRDGTIKCTDWKIHVEIGSPTFMANIYRVYNGVCNDVYKYDVLLVTNCSSYDVFYCV
jgi:hypothetical protein